MHVTCAKQNCKNYIRSFFLVFSKHCFDAFQGSFFSCKFEKSNRVENGGLVFLKNYISCNSPINNVDGAEIGVVWVFRKLCQRGCASFIIPFSCPSFCIFLTFSCELYVNLKKYSKLNNSFRSWNGLFVLNYSRDSVFSKKINWFLF